MHLGIVELKHLQIIVQKHKHLSSCWFETEKQIQKGKINKGIKNQQKNLKTTRKILQ